MLFENEDSFDAFFNAFAWLRDGILLKHFAGGILLTHAEQNDEIPYWGLSILKRPYQNNTSESIVMPKVDLLIDRGYELGKAYHAGKISFSSRGKIVKARCVLEKFLESTQLGKSMNGVQTLSTKAAVKKYLISIGMQRPIQRGR